MIHTMVELGLLAPVAGSRRLRLTLRCLGLGYGALSDGKNAYGLRTVAAPILGRAGTAHAAASLMPPLLAVARDLSNAVRLVASAA